MSKTLTVREMMDRLRVSKNTAYTLAKKSDFYPAYKIGKKILIDSDLLEKWIEEQGRKKGDGKNAG